MRVAPSLVPLSRIEHYEVINPRGDVLGRVHDFVVDMVNGRIPYLILAVGGVVGLGDKIFAIPWNMLSWAPDGRRLVLDMAPETFKRAPGLDRVKWPEQVSAAWLSQCSQFYGCEPYYQTTEQRAAAAAQADIQPVPTAARAPVGTGRGPLGLTK